MTPEEKDRIRLNLIDYVTGTVDEWLRLAHFNQTPEDIDGIQYRISWEHPTDRAMIANLSETPYGEPLARYGVQIVVDTLPDLPPIGPEDDLGIYGIDERPECPACGKAEPHTSAECAPAWTPSTFLYVLAGDRIRIGTDETDVLRSSSGAWHANVVSSVLPSGKVWDKVTPWEHTELRLDLSANPGFREYPADTPCEILCTPERLAVLTLMTVFPGTKEIKP